MSTIAVNRPLRTATRPMQPNRLPTAVRLTRRGRIVVTLLFLAAVLALVTAFGPGVVATGETGEPVPTRTVVVGEGDTLWGIASEVAEPGRTRELVREIVELNSLSSVTIHSGQELAVPLQ